MKSKGRQSRKQYNCKPAGLSDALVHVSMVYDVFCDEYSLSYRNVGAGAVNLFGLCVRLHSLAKLDRK